MINSKQRAFLRSMCNTLKASEQIGKGGISESLIEQLNESLELRELIKINVLETSPVRGKECAQTLAGALQAEIIQVIGSKIVLYRQASDPDKRQIELPKK